MKPRKKEPTEVRRQQITEAALRIIGTKGISGATTAEIASASGISEGNLYRHFKGKEEILGSVIDKIGNDLASILDAAADIAEPLRRLEEIFKRHLSYIEEHVGIPRTIFTEEVLVLNETLREKVRGNLMHYFRGISAVIEQGQEAGALNREMDPNALATMFIGTVNFTALRWVMNKFSSKLSDEGERLWETFVKSLVCKV
ncbi:transcriptional regulator, TetR family [Geobacter metallireducens RCH3]|uniref:Transcriptional regulator, TetR family n=1 Tax=Geobacter metallireducens (strain ATCC 53774 / DSM 7210 / GS-15) TaxID=269799 RepID=Q39PZ9_GEOMG|nr:MULTISPECIES: TetR/AcrR family transcriptional regulator [Geobacter]ABB33675.1 transcriptional regulator, TetR family [Geobacter metallireducens GS-15]EHP85371.1 transcriptional regulator, TetR family [Geobacter metallireducens RCH3]MBT1074014.1 TetR/AcrR family transcriptional regulator [Geobacter grbiciae]